MNPLWCADVPRWHGGALSRIITSQHPGFEYGYWFCVEFHIFSLYQWISSGFFDSCHFQKT